MSASTVASVPAHEIIHGVANTENGIQTFIPEMTPEQQDLFKKARKGLKARYNRHDNTLQGRIRTWLTGKTTVGLRGYAFYKDEEFLTTTIDAFYKAPDKLRKTPEGRQLYDLYREFFRIDPLNNYADISPTLDASA